MTHLKPSFSSKLYIYKTSFYSQLWDRKKPNVRPSILSGSGVYA